MSARVRYEVLVQTDRHIEDGQTVHLGITLYGEQARSEQAWLIARGSPTAGVGGNAFAFSVETTDLGALTKARIRLEGADGEDASWCLDWVVVKRADTHEGWRFDLRGWMAWDGPSNCMTVAPRDMAVGGTSNGVGRPLPPRAMAGRPNR